MGGKNTIHENGLYLRQRHSLKLKELLEASRIAEMKMAEKLRSVVGDEVLFVPLYLPRCPLTPRSRHPHCDILLHTHVKKYRGLCNASDVLAHPRRVEIRGPGHPSGYIQIAWCTCGG